MVKFTYNTSNIDAALEGFPQDIVDIALEEGITNGLGLGRREARSILRSKIQDREYSTGALESAIGIVYPQKQRNDLSRYGVLGVSRSEEHFREEIRKRKDGVPYSTRPYRNKGKEVRVRRPPQYHPTQEGKKKYIEGAVANQGEAMYMEVVKGIQNKWSELGVRARKRGKIAGSKNKYKK